MANHKSKSIVATRRRLEDLLQESEDRFRLLADTAPLMIGMTDEKGNCNFCNSLLQEFTGVSLSQSIGLSWAENIHPEDKPQFRNSYLAAFNSRSKFQIEYRLKGADGEYRWILDTGVPRITPNGNFIGYINTAIDITAQKEASAALKKNQNLQEKLTALKQQARILDQLCDSVITTDLNGIVTSWNKAAERIYGYRASEAIGQSIIFIYPPEQQDFFPQQILPALQQQGVYEGEVPSLHKSGKIGDIFLNVSLERNELGEVVGMIGYAIDITDRKRLEKERQQQEAALRESEERFRAISEQAAVGIAFTGTDGKFLWLNQKLCDLVGYTKEEMLKLSYKELSHPDDSEGDRQYMTKILAGENVKSREKRYIRKDGSIIWVSVTVSIIRDESGIYKYDIAIMEDISDRKLAEAALREREQFLASIYDGVEQAIFVYDVLPNGEFRHVGWNPLKEQIIGISSQQASGKTFEELFPHSVAAFMHQHHMDCLDAGTSISYEEFVTIPESNVETWWNTTLSPLRDINGKIYRIVGTSTNITSRKQAEEALRKSEGLYRALVENFPGGSVFLFDRDRRFLIAGGSELIKAGLNPASLEGKTPLEIWSVEDYRPFDPLYAAALSGEVLRCETPYRDLMYFTQVVPLKNCVGEIFGGLLIIQNITDRKRAEQALEESANRLELLNKIASQVRASLDIDTILENTVISIRDLLEIDACTFAWYRQNNPSFSPVDREDEGGSWEIVKESKKPNLPSFLGVYSSSQVAPMSEKSLKQETLRVDDAEAVSDPILRQNLLAYNCLSMLTVPFQTQGGEIGTLSCSQHSVKRPWRDSEVELLKNVADNLTIAIHQAELYKQSQVSAKIASERARELEQALQQLQRTQTQLIQSEKMSSLGQLVAGVAHEINNPVSFIYGNINPAREYISDLLNLIELYQSEYPHPTPAIKAEIEAIELEFLVEDLPKLLDSMKLGADRIREIVLSLRNFSRMDEAQIKDVDLHEGIDSTLRLLQNRLKAKPDHPEIVVNKNYGKLPLVECYAGQLNQVFMNLLTNAIDALEERDKRRTPFDIKANPSTIEITTSVVDGEKIAVSIADNGPGIPNSVRARIFDPFFTTKPVGKGTGLGLAISYQIVVEKHFGSLNCHSVPSQGTEFIMEIPIKQNSYRINT